MYYADYMKLYYLRNKEKIKARANKWRKDNLSKVRNIQQIYREEHKSILNDFIKEKIESLPFEERVSQETLSKMKENSRINQQYVKNYKLIEGVFSNPYIKKKLLEEGD